MVKESKIYIINTSFHKWHVRGNADVRTYRGWRGRREDIEVLRGSAAA